MPQAVAHKGYTGGIAYGVDPYSSAEVMQEDNEALRDKLRQFVETTDFERMLSSDVLALWDRLSLAAHCRIVRKTSEAAADDFAAVGNAIRFDSRRRKPRHRQGAPGRRALLAAPHPRRLPGHG